MTTGREHEIAQSFVALANTLVEGFDVVELFSELTTDCARLLDIASCGLLLASPHGELHVIAASSEAARQLELYQVQRAEGPCLDAFATNAPVRVPDLAGTDRWPAFTASAIRSGFRSVHALPMTLRGKQLGALGLFGTGVGDLADSEIALAQSLAHVAAVALVTNDAAVDGATLNAQLRHAMTSRLVIEQAKGLLAQLGGLEMEEAFTALRRYARDHNQRLTHVATETVARRLPAQQVLDQANKVRARQRR